MTWIDCRDCLPEDSVVVLVHVSVPHCECDPVWLAYWEHGTWRYVSGVRIGRRVTHWQPRPDPPEGVEDGEDST